MDAKQNMIWRSKETGELYDISERIKVCGHLGSKNAFIIYGFRNKQDRTFYGYVRKKYLTGHFEPVVMKA